MDNKSAQYIEQELVISTATNSADKSNFDFLEGNTIQFDNGDKVANTLSTNFLGFEDFDIQRVMGNYHCGTDHSLYELQNEISKFLATEETLVLGSYEGLCAEIPKMLSSTTRRCRHRSGVASNIAKPKNSVTRTTIWQNWRSN